MIRRFANIVVEKGSSGMCSLHRVDILKRLFYPSPAAADAANNKTGNKIPTLPRLPPPVTRFHPSPTESRWWSSTMELFALLSPRSSEDMIIFSDAAGRTALYHADSHSVSPMPSSNGVKGFMPTVFSIVRPNAPLEDFYVLGSALSSFDVLRFSSSKYWCWDPLPSPPFTCNLWSHAVVDDGKTICVSADPSCGATYCFDTVKREWRQAAGDWQPPFVGGTEYIQDLKFWLGFASDSYNLCAWDLSAMDQPPTLLYSLPNLKTPEDWSVTSARLLNLGSGRFCVAKIFHTRGDDFYDQDIMGNKFAVLTGVEVVTGSGESKIERIVQHKSLLHTFNGNKVGWVL